MIQEQSHHLNSLRCHLVSMLTERIEWLSCTRQHLLGSRHSGTSMRISSTREVSFWKFKVTTVKRDNQSLLGRSITERTKDGSLDTERTTVVTSKEKARTAISDFSSMSLSMRSTRETPSLRLRLLEEET